MSSIDQIEANRRNAQFCTGPTTVAGKDASKMNALRHGLTSQQVVLPYEDPAQFHQVLAELRDEHAPAAPSEEDFVEELAIAKWRLLRARRI
ncbi:MAG: hypothetical protein ABI165_21655, partial [Bryobacteraceae bacterium]